MPAIIKPFTESDSPFLALLETPFGLNGERLYDAFNALGESVTKEYNGIKCIIDNEKNSLIIDEFIKVLEDSPKLSEYENNFFNTFIYISSDPGFAAKYHNLIFPEDKEICLFISHDPVEGSVESLKISISAGEQLKELLTTYLAVNSPSSSRYLDLFIRTFTEKKINEILTSGKLQDQNLNEGSGFLQFINITNLSIGPLDSLIELINKDFDLTYITDSYSDYCQKILIKKVENLLTSEIEDDINFLDLSEDFLEDLKNQFDWYLGKIPEIEFAAIFFFQQLAERIKNSELIKLYTAKNEFEKALFDTLTSTESLQKVFNSAVEAFNKNKGMLGDILIGGSVVGSIAFIIGTIYQIIYDIINTFVQIIKYSFKGAAYLYNEAKESLSAQPVTGLTPASDSVIFDLFKSIDVKAFVRDDLPVLVEDLQTLINEIKNDFIVNAKSYGKTTGEYIVKILGSIPTGGMSLFFEKYNPNASVSVRIYYVIRQWFNMGALIGPALVDIILFFCGGAGVISAAAKLGKIDKIADLLKFTQRSADVIKSLTHYQKIVDKIPVRLTELIKELFEKLWNAAGPAAEQIKDFIRTAYNTFPDQNKLPDVEVIAAMVDTWYERCETLNFFIGIIVMLSGLGNIDSEGELTIV